MKRSKAKVLIVALIVFAALCYPLLTVMRQYTIPFFADIFFSKSVEKEFNASFGDINTGFNSLGFNQYRMSEFIPEEANVNCFEDLTYQGLSETVTCKKLVAPDPFVPDDDLIAKWKSDSHKLLNTLQSNGWKMTESFISGEDISVNSLDQQLFSEIFDGPNRSPANHSASQIIFSKFKNNVECSLQISYANNGPSPVKSIWIYERCSRDVKFFGGVS